MLKHLLLVLVSFQLINFSIDAQEKKMWADANTIKTFSSTARKDPTYIKMRAEIDALSKSATKTNTNETAVRKVLVASRSVLSSLYKEANIAPPRLRGSLPPAKPINSTSTEEKEWRKLYPAGVTMEVPPFDRSWHWTARNNVGQVFPDTTGTQFSTGKTVFTLKSDPGKQIGPYFHGQEQSFTVPSDPRIVSAVLVFEFSILFTGWDTFGAIFGADLIVEGSDNLGGDIKTELSPYDYPLSFNHNWRKLQTVIKTDTVTSEIEGFLRQNDTYSFIISRLFVTPGSTFKIKIGVGYPKNARLGANGNYHYGEFILKKITVGYSTRPL